ncbi:23S rRNA (adenine(2503)-C(2))-methyltransferase RlmN [bacterium]|nr:23S rRNA (adenine(2503)-C(2))-methyltransferase RlmN [bacterium]
MKINIKALSLPELTEKFKELGLEGYRALQVKKWLYQKQVASFDEMTNIKKEVRDLLKENFEIPRIPVMTYQQSSDGTRKYLLEMTDGSTVESVFIPSEGRNTLCVSSQVGCAMDCKFCLTAQMGLKRNLSIFEIVDQVGAVARDVGADKRITNLVFMGMGEPLANTKNLYASLEILLDQDCYNFSRQHITVSTSGIAPQIEKFGDATPVKLAISLNATTDEVRDAIMPINKKFPIKDLLGACKRMTLPKRNRITFEYVMLHGVNDSLDDAKRLVKLLGEMKAKINLIPFNESPDSPFKRPPDAWIFKFQKILLDKGFVANIRRSRGRDILGACGQLATNKAEFIKPDSGYQPAPSELV